MQIRVVIADDHKMIRAGLRRLLDEEKGIEVVAEASDGREAIELVRQHEPELVIMDVGMPTLNGVEATHQIKLELPKTAVIALSMHARVEFVGKMLEAGASAYVLKDSAYEELLDAIRTVRRGNLYLSPGITGIVIDDYIRRRVANPEKITAALTPREREIAQLLAEGRSTKETAAELHVSIKTVETHRMHIFQKLNISSIAELTKYAIREGLTSLE